MGVGLPDQGKTLIAVDVSARLTVGSPLAPDPCRPGVQPPRRGVVCTNEDTLSVIRARLEKAGADLAMIDFIQMVRAAHGGMSPLGLSEDLDAIEDTVASRQPALLIVDGIMGYLGDVKTHNDADVRRVLMPFVALLARTGTAGLGLMHPPKAVTNLHYYA